ncbi:hypothetical protein [Acidicapsa acidisoli]|uniref:hypothetical protein n=1 Tax=Acidicapsa acidisoli TaxID=1615681 RepID=UPI0021DF8290|nr:hypothetical protein [Acidicapsa acidisoli]
MSQFSTCIVSASLAFAVTISAQAPAPEVAQQSTTQRTAQLIGALADVRKLEAMSASTTLQDRWQILWMHQCIYEKIMMASLQVDATIAQIDNEISRANELRGYLSDRRDRLVSRANLFSSIVGGAVGATSSGLQASSTLNRTGAFIGIGAGSFSAGLALVGIRAQPGKSSAFDFPSNMLAPLFDRPALQNSQYQETIWTFLNEAPPKSITGLTRREELLRSWVQVRRIDSLSSTDKIDHVTSQPSEGLKLSIDDLEDRAAMLQDVRARVSYLKRDLGELMASLPKVADAIRTSDSSND